MTEPSLDDVAEAEIRTYYRAGLTAAVLSKRYGVSERTVLRLVEPRRRGPRPRSGAVVPTDEIVRLRDVEHLTWVQIAARTGLAWTTCSNRYRRRPGVSHGERPVTR